MKRIFKFRVFIFFIIAIIIATITLISVNTRGDAGIFSNTLTALSKPIQSVAATVAKSFESLYGYIYEYDEVVADNANLRAQLSQLQQEYREYTDVSNENESLRALLGLSARHPDFKQYDTASVINRSPSNWSTSITIGKGSSNSDIKIGDCVITETGALIGIISKVGTKTSTAITVLDTTFAVGAYIDQNEELAIAAGDFTLMKQGLLKFDYLSDTTQIVAGDTIISVGQDGILPAGLIIGTVEEVLTYKTGISRYATIKPAANLQSLANVYLITSFEITGDGE